MDESMMCNVVNNMAFTNLTQQLDHPLRKGPSCAMHSSLMLLEIIVCARLPADISPCASSQATGGEDNTYGEDAAPETTRSEQEQRDDEAMLRRLPTRWRSRGIPESPDASPRPSEFEANASSVGASSPSIGVITFSEALTSFHRWERDLPSEGCPGCKFGCHKTSTGQQRESASAAGSAATTKGAGMSTEVNGPALRL